VKAGKFALLERALKLKKKTEAYVSELVSCRPRFAVDSVRSVDSESIDPPSLVLPKGTLEEERSAYIIRTDLARLFRLLKKEPFDGVKVVRMLSFSWANGPVCMSRRFPLIWSCLLCAWGASSAHREWGHLRGGDP